MTEDFKFGPAWSGPTCCGKPVGCNIVDGCIMLNHPWKRAHPRVETGPPAPEDTSGPETDTTTG